MITYLDSHCHITSDRLYARIDEILENCHAHQVGELLVICCQHEEYLRAMQLKQQHPFIHVAYGFYPCDTSDLQESDWTRLEEICRTHQVDVIGEIGLDHHYDDTDKEKQHDALIRQLKLAAECDLPISIHMRDATADCLDLLKTYAKTPFVMHCFSGSVETAMEVVRMGGYISFAGPLTFKNARALPEVAKIVPAERILCETDCPYLTPVPHRGKENEPMYVRFTFDKICELRNADPQRMSEQILQNYHRFLGK